MRGGGGGGRGVLPDIGYTGMCRWKGYGFQAIYSGIRSSNHRELIKLFLSQDQMKTSLLQLRGYVDLKVGFNETIFVLRYFNIRLCEAIKQQDACKVFYCLSILREINSSHVCRRTQTLRMVSFNFYPYIVLKAFIGCLQRRTFDAPIYATAISENAGI